MVNTQPLTARFGLRRLRQAFTRIESLDTVAETVAAIRDEQRAAVGEVKALRMELAILRRSHDFLAQKVTLPAPETWSKTTARRPAAARSNSPRPWLKSELCRQESLEDAVFLSWVARLGEAPGYHRKQWEFCYIAQALWERGVLRPGARGLGFGVGGEPLSALFASEGCSVVGTDLAGDMAVGTGWIETEQHAAGKETLRRPSVCDDAAFDARVSFRAADMNAIADDLTDFDFCWSACALEHLGSIAAGLTFIERSLDTLKPGGWAVHTSEFNLTSNTATIEEGPTVLFRRCDLEALTDRLRAQGHRVEPFDWSTGDRPLDRYVDLPPYLHEPHLKLLFDGYAATSVGMIIQKAG